MNDNVIILAGGQGKRMKTDKPKVLCEVLGVPMLRWVISACEDAGLNNLCIVKGFGAEILDEYLGGKYETVMQYDRLGTGHAVMQAVDFLKKNENSHTLVLCGDAPFIDDYTINEALELHNIKGADEIKKYFDEEVKKANTQMVSYKAVGFVKIREEEFYKNTSRKIIRYKIDKTID